MTWALHHGSCDGFSAGCRTLRYLSGWSAKRRQICWNRGLWCYWRIPSVIWNRLTALLNRPWSHWRSSHLRCLNSVSRGCGCSYSEYSSSISGVGSNAWTQIHATELARHQLTKLFNSFGKSCLLTSWYQIHTVGILERIRSYFMSLPCLSSVKV